MSFEQENIKTTETTTKTDKKKPNYRYMRDKDREPVRGIFRFHEVPGGSMSFVYHAYKGDPVERYDLIDGVACTVPLGVAKHLNKNGWYPVHAHRIEENGKASVHIGQKVRRFSFQSLEFVDIEDLSPNGAPMIETVISI